MVEVDVITGNRDQKDTKQIYSGLIGWTYKVLQFLTLVQGYSRDVLLVIKVKHIRLGFTSY